MNSNLQQMTLFPTKNTLQEAVDYAQSQLPITEPNQLVSCLMVYHNTLLYVTEQVEGWEVVPGDSQDMPDNLDAGETVEVEYRNGGSDIWPFPEDMNWFHEGGANDPIRYRKINQDSDDG
jgi:hypothetical protein